MTPSLQRFIVILLIISVSLLPGCWDRKELNNLAIITGIGIDLLPDNRIELMVQQVVPQPNLGNGGEGRNSEKTLIQTGIGETIVDAKEDLQKKVGRFLFWGHAETVVFSKRMAQKGIREQIDFLVRFPEIRMRAKLFVSDDPQEILAAKPEVEAFSVRTFKFFSQLGSQLSVDLNEIVQMLEGKAGDIFLPRVKVAKPNQIPYINGTAIFKKDQLIQYINEADSRAILWLKDRFKKGIVTVLLEEGHVGVRLFNAKTKLIPRIEKGKWKMIVNIKGSDDVYLNETRFSKDPRFTKIVEKEIEKEIRRVILHTVHHLQEKKADVIGFADVFYRTYPHEWNQVKNNWDDIFSQVEVIVNPKVKVKRTGMTDEPIGLP